MLFPFFGQSSISNRETNSHNDEDDLHGPHKDVDNPSAPAFESDSNHHINPKDPGVLSRLCQSMSEARQGGMLSNVPEPSNKEIPG